MSESVEIEDKLRALKPVLREKYQVEKIGYFWSFARNEQHEDSDIDILVEFRRPLGWEFFDLQDFLEHELNRKIDLVSIKALKEQLKGSILQQTKYV